MASIIVRGLDEDVKRRLAAQARSHDRSMEAEVRAILTREVGRPTFALALMAAGDRVGGLDDVEIPPRGDDARAVDFG